MGSERVLVFERIIAKLSNMIGKSNFCDACADEALYACLCNFGIMICVLVQKSHLAKKWISSTKFPCSFQGLSTTANLPHTENC